MKIELLCVPESPFKVSPLGVDQLDVLLAPFLVVYDALQEFVGPLRPTAARRRTHCVNCSLNFSASGLEIDSHFSIENKIR